MLSVVVSVLILFWFYDVFPYDVFSFLLSPISCDVCLFVWLYLLYTYIERRWARGSPFPKDLSIDLLISGVYPFIHLSSSWSDERRDSAYAEIFSPVNRWVVVK